MKIPNVSARAAGEFFSGKGPRVTLKNPCVPVEVHSFPSSAHPGVWIVKVVLVTKDRDTGEVEYISQTEEINGSAASPPGPLRVAAIVRNLLQTLFMHEVDEMIHVDGVRVFDPHGA